MTDVKLPEPAAVFHVQLFRECPSMRNVDLVERQEFSAGSHDLFTADQLTAAVMAERERLRHYTRCDECHEPCGSIALCRICEGIRYEGRQPPAEDGE